MRPALIAAAKTAIATRELSQRQRADEEELACSRVGAYDAMGTT